MKKKFSDGTKQYSGFGDCAPLMALRSAGPKDRVDTRVTIDPDFKISKEVIETLKKPTEHIKSFSGVGEFGPMFALAGINKEYNNMNIKTYIDPAFGVNVMELEFKFNEYVPDVSIHGDRI